MDRELKMLLERGIAAIESLAEDPVIHVETQPPVCPNCDEMNPVVRISAEANDGEGPLANFILKATCLRCNSSLFMFPTQMECFSTLEEVAEVATERNVQRGFNGGTNQGT